MELALLDIIDLQEDSLRFYYLGKDKGPKVKHYGTKESYDLESAIII
ncbi:CRISPR-associated protein cas2 [Centipeda periodontii DSM 2778]|uniref:CRISPR-associated protein cas2 n=1 Tax=Centipeda periodontii DSM 2778 TaxID=888060 RepID=F5RNT3_9FIRM|nr:CRISPR-associated protein cas2 [Centipeda periodontii DSM 2778]